VFSCTGDVANGGVVSGSDDGIGTAGAAFSDVVGGDTRCDGDSGSDVGAGGVGESGSNDHGSIFGSVSGSVGGSVSGSAGGTDGGSIMRVMAPRQRDWNKTAT
jgi:hypothetical protein